MWRSVLCSSGISTPLQGNHMVPFCLNLTRTVAAIDRVTQSQYATSTGRIQKLRLVLIPPPQITGLPPVYVLRLNWEGGVDTSEPLHPCNVPGNPFSHSHESTGALNPLDPEQVYFASLPSITLLRIRASPPTSRMSATALCCAISFAPLGSFSPTVSWWHSRS